MKLGKRRPQSFREADGALRQPTRWWNSFIRKNWKLANGNYKVDFGKEFRAGTTENVSAPEGHRIDISFNGNLIRATIPIF